jgi:hypothetical protein
MLDDDAEQMLKMFVPRLRRSYGRKGFSRHGSKNLKRSRPSSLSLRLRERTCTSSLLPRTHSSCQPTRVLIIRANLREFVYSRFKRSSFFALPSVLLAKIDSTKLGICCYSPLTGSLASCHQSPLERVPLRILQILPWHLEVVTVSMKPQGRLGYPGWMYRLLW